MVQLEFNFPPLLKSCLLTLSWSQLAVKRLVQYWDKRVELFGKQKAFMPLTLSALEDEDMLALVAGFSSVMEGTDESGRGIFMVNPSKKDLSKYSRVAMVRAIWYMVHAMLESHESIQQKGVVVIICSRDAKLSHFDRKLDDMILQSLKGVLPMRISVFHICQPPTVFALVFPFLRMMIGPRLRKKIKVHSDSTDHVLEQLARYGLSKNILPAELGGMRESDSVKWLEARKKAEE
jgi:CRAL/TRIO domain